MSEKSPQQPSGEFFLRASESPEEPVSESPGPDSGGAPYFPSTTPPPGVIETVALPPESVFEDPQWADRIAAGERGPGVVRTGPGFAHEQIQPRPSNALGEHPWGTGPGGAAVMAGWPEEPPRREEPVGPNKILLALVGLGVLALLGVGGWLLSPDESPERRERSEAAPVIVAPSTNPIVPAPVVPTGPPASEAPAPPPPTTKPVVPVIKPPAPEEPPAVVATQGPVEEEPAPAPPAPAPPAPAPAPAPVRPSPSPSAPAATAESSRRSSQAWVDAALAGDTAEMKRLWNSPNQDENDRREIAQDIQEIQPQFQRCERAPRRPNNPTVFDCHWSGQGSLTVYVSQESRVVGFSLVVQPPPK